MSKFLADGRFAILGGSVVPSPAARYAALDLRNKEAGGKGNCEKAASKDENLRRKVEGNKINGEKKTRFRSASLRRNRAA